MTTIIPPTDPKEFYELLRKQHGQDRKYATPADIFGHATSKQPIDRAESNLKETVRYWIKKGIKSKLSLSKYSDDDYRIRIHNKEIDSFNPSEEGSLD